MSDDRTTLVIVEDWLNSNNFIIIKLSNIKEDLHYIDVIKESYPTDLKEDSAMLALNMITHELWLVKYDLTLNSNILKYENSVDYLWLLIDAKNISEMDVNEKAEKLKSLSDKNVGLITVDTTNSNLDVEKRIAISVNAGLRKVISNIRIAIFNLNEIKELRVRNQPFWVNAVNKETENQPKNEKIDNLNPIPSINTSPDTERQENTLNNYEAHLKTTKYAKGTIPGIAADINKVEEESDNTFDINPSDIEITDLDSLMKWCESVFGFGINHPVKTVDIIETSGFDFNFNLMREEIQDLVKGLKNWEDCKNFVQAVNVINEKANSL